MYQEDPFNSLKALSAILGVSEESLPTDLTGRYKDLPFQIKAMLVMSTMTQRVNINGMSVRRFKSKDHDPVEQSTDAIKYYDDLANMQMQNPPYKDLYDPMKTYAKFLSFWLNFKQIVKIEYLHSFGSLAAPIGGLHPAAANVINLNSPGRPVWKELTREEYSEMTNGGTGKVLCRISDINPQSYNDGEQMDNTTNQDLLQRSFEKNKSLELPIYHRYFFLGQDEGLRK